MNIDTNEEKKLLDPEVEIRTDLWHTMTMSQLNHQRDLMIDKLGKLRSMMGFGMSATRTVLDLHAALDRALKDLTLLIDNKASQKLPVKGPNG